MAIARSSNDELQRKTMRTSFVSFVAGVALTTCIAALAQQQVPKPDTGELPSNAGTVIDKTRSAAPSASAASKPASAASGVLRMRRPAASAPR
jgi:hypothetical protein